MTLQKAIGEMDGSRQYTGSRNSDGHVPNVNWNVDNRKLNVNWYNPDNANDNLRSRAEVSTKKEHQAPFCVRYFCQPVAIRDIS